MMESKKPTIALLHPSKGRIRHGIVPSAFLVGVLALMALVSGKGMKAWPGQQSTESAPLVKPAVDGVLDLFKQRPVVALGDFHWLAQEESFYSSLVRDPRFAESVGNVVVEFGGEVSQGIIDRYVAGENVPLTELRKVWTETAGWVPGPTSLGYVNFFVNVRAANLKLPPEHRIKVWLGEPKIEWSQVKSWQDLQSYFPLRDDNYFRIISEDILKKQKKTLLIIGTGHLFGPEGPGPVKAKIDAAYPNKLAVVSPFAGYVEAECNARIAAQTKDWPTPSVVGPVKGTRLQAQLQLPNCKYSVNDQHDMWANSEAILYLGEPDSLTVSAMDPNIYLDLDYFNEENRRLRCCTPNEPLDWDKLFQGGTPSQGKFNYPH